MNVSGTLHLYSGEDKELFFVFDDDVAQQLYGNTRFKIGRMSRSHQLDLGGLQRVTHLRTLSFSKKQTEIKISLCSQGAKGGSRCSHLTLRMVCKER